MSKDTIKVALAGIGNLSSALVQSVQYYKDHSTRELMHPKIGGFSIPDIEVVAAYDIDKRKVGKDLAEAIFAEPNNQKDITDLIKTGVIVEKAPVMDGLSEYTNDVIQISDDKDVNIVKSLEKSGAELLIINTPSGANEVAKFFADAAYKVKIGLINSTPSSIIRDKEIARKFVEIGRPIIGDDLQSQAGGTVFHKGILEVLNEQAVYVENTYQLDVSGGLEGLTTLDYDRRSLKRSTKESSIKRSLPYDIKVAAGTTDYLDFLGSRRIGHYWIFGKSFLGQDVKIDIRMEVDDSNGAASLVDAIRASELALRRTLKGPIISVCAHLFKAPPENMSRRDANASFEEFIKRTD